MLFLLFTICSTSIKKWSSFFSYVKKSRYIRVFLLLRKIYDILVYIFDYRVFRGTKSDSILYRAPWWEIRKFDIYYLGCWITCGSDRSLYSKCFGKYKLYEIKCGTTLTEYRNTKHYFDRWTRVYHLHHKKIIQNHLWIIFFALVKSELHISFEFDSEFEESRDIGLLYL